MGNLDNYQENFSKNLNYYLELRGKRQQDLIDDLGFSSSTTSSWCTGGRIPRMNRVQMLADYLGIQVSDLLEERKTENIQDELFEKKKILFSMSEKATAEDLDKIIAIADMILGGK